MPSNPFVSIIIPCREVDAYAKECLDKCLKLDYANFEVVLLPDKETDNNGLLADSRVRVVPTGSIKPSLKRNLAISNSQADILAFIDSDAYPEPSWISSAVKYFANEKIGMVGGPNITPPSDSLTQKASGDIFSSFAGAGLTALRYLAREKFRQGLPVKEMPSCNLFVRRNLAEKIGGFDGKFMTGEDSKFCFQIRKLGVKLINAYDVVVYHHRRKLFWGHFKQVWVYGRDKAWLVKEDFAPDKLYYFVPSLFVLGLFSGILIWSVDWLRWLYLIVVGFYSAVVLLASLLKVKTAPLVFVGIIATHITYGISFLYGLVTKHR